MWGVHRWLVEPLFLCKNILVNTAFNFWHVSISFANVWCIYYLMSMKVICVSLCQVYQLTTARKSFILLVNGTWQTKADWTSLVQQRMGSTAYAVFQLSIDVNTAAEEYCVEYLGLKSLPSLVMFSRGNLVRTVELSHSVNLTEYRNASYLLDEFKRYHARNAAVIESWSLSQNRGDSCVKLFLSGDRSSVGKSSMCLAMLVSLLKRGVPPSALAYIKPVTQCEAEQPVTQFCDRVGIANRGIGPVVFYKGFTRAYLAGETGTAESLLKEAKAAVDEISMGKQFVLVDGVGYPSVGSICNISNADVARKLDAPVLLIGKSGVGDAVDSYNLNSAYFQTKGVHVLGGIFNKLPLDGYYSLDACRESVTSYFQQHNRTQLPYGFVPLLDIKPGAQVSPTDSSSSSAVGLNEANEAGNTVQAAMDVCSSPDTVPKPVITFTEFENALSDAFMRNVDMDRLIHDVWIYEICKGMVSTFGTHGTSPKLPCQSTSAPAPAPVYAPISSASLPIVSSANNDEIITNNDSTHSSSSTAIAPSSLIKRSRQEVEAEARKKGATGG